ncbi:hypothetical protein [uncultured Draconibacterium sp.]|uniref:hypothetical protein n=1 Tax=uncultured Draconibacterium sp. TaxID=1573823 RepID=UPI0029C89DF5|nr:hypothetical protein [uncultured Draconibacterium sp.]
MAETTREEKEQLNKLKELIEQRLGWGAAEFWTHYQFEELQENILHKTNVSLSPNTLKRFFGKIKSDSSASKTTKNTLAEFVGYSNFSDFINKNTKNTPHFNRLDWLTGLLRNKYVRYTFLLGIVIFSIFLITVLVQQQKQKKDLKSAVFKQVYDSGTVPFTQIFRYSFDRKVKDTIYFNEFNKGNIPLSTTDSIFSWIHFVPGYREVRFITDNEILCNSSYLVRTDGWLCIFPWGGWQPRKYISLNECETYLTVSDEVLQKNNIDLEEDGNWIHYFNAQEYNVPGTDFSLETRIQNKLKTGQQQCQDAIITIECETYKFKIHFTQLGCQRFAELTLGDEYYSGTQNDLTKLTLDMNEWQDIRITVKDKILSVFNKDKLLLERQFDGSPGNITMLQYSFRGNGMADHITLKNGEGNVTYIDDFR